MIFSKNNEGLNDDAEQADFAVDAFSESEFANNLLAESTESAVNTSGPLRPSIISEGFEFVGELKAPQGNVTIDGTFKGTLAVKSLIVGKEGLVEGSIQANTVTLKGTMKGTIDVGDLQVSGNASLDGQTVYRDLTIARGAEILGELKRRP